MLWYMQGLMELCVQDYTVNPMRVMHYSTPQLLSKTLVHSIPYSLYLRTKWNCSKEHDFREEAGKFKQRLLESYYKTLLKKKGYNRECKLSTQEIVFPSNKREPDFNQVRFVTKYNAQHQYIRQIFERHWHLLLSNNSVRRFIGPLTPGYF